MMSGRAVVSGLALAAAFGAACASTSRLPGTIDPRSLAVSASDGSGGHEPDVADQVLTDILRRMRVETCAVSAAVATRDTLVDPGTEAEIRRLDVFSRLLCDAGVHEVDARWAADGAIEVRGPDDGEIAADGALFIFDGFESWSAAGVATAAEQPACGGAVALRPDLTLYSVDGGPASLTLEAADGGFVSVGYADGGDDCVDVVEGAATVPVPPGEVVRVWVGTRGEPVDWRARVESSGARGRSTHALTWSWGSPFDMPVYVGPYFESPESNDYTWCSGFVSEEPTARVYVPEEGYGFISVHSDADPVLVVRGPGGEVLCNDDYDGLDPAVDAWFSRGDWEVWVGSFSSGVEFEATLSFE